MLNRLIPPAAALLAAVPGVAEPLDEADLDRRIDELRKADFALTLRDAGGEILDQPVAYRLQRHAFEFGTAINARMVAAPGADNPPNADDLASYDDIVTRYFSAVVVENAHKWYAMENERAEPTGDERALFMYDWAAKRGLKMRGHCVFWGVDRWQRKWSRELAKQPPEVIEQRMKRRLDHVLTLFKGKISEWDLNNEMMHEDIFADAMGLTSKATYFEWAKQHSPDITFYVNEYGVLQGDEVDKYVEHIRELIEDGADVGGIGDQAHFFKPIPTNQELWAILDKLGQFGLPVKITEFDLDYKDMTEQEQAEQLRRFYRVCFAHPAVEGIYMWGFCEARHWRTDAAIWRKDFTPKPAAEAYMKLMEDDWHTEGSATPSDGVIKFRGFPGRYELTIGDRTTTIDLTKDAPNVDVTIQP